MNRIKYIKQVNQHFYYGWIIVGLAALATFFSSPGQTYAISAFIDSYIKDFQFSRTLVSSIYSLATVLSGSLLVFVGRAVDKYGQRVMFIVVGTMLSLACFFNSLISGIPMLFAGFFLLRYFGQGSMTLIPGSLVPQWFEKKRAFALSLLTMGTIVGNLLIPRFNVFMIANHGWQMTWRFWSLMLIIVFVPLALIFVVNKPEDIGLLPDNVKVKDDDHLKDELEQVAKTSFTLKEAMKTKEFWFIAIISMLTPMIGTGLMFHFYSIMAEKGIDTESAALIIGFIAIPGFIMPIIAGTIIDKYRSRHIIFVALTCIALSLVFFISIHTLWMAGIFLILYGLFSNIKNITIQVIWVKYFGRQYLGSIKGLATVFVVLGSALGTMPFGISYDTTGSYNGAFIAMIVLTVLSMGMSLSIRKPKKL